MESNPSFSNFQKYYAFRDADLSHIAYWCRTQKDLDSHLQATYKRPIRAKLFYKDGESAENGNTPVGVCAVMDGELVVAYRGTEFLNAGDYKADISFTSTKMKIGNDKVSVHSGFYKAFLESKEGRDKAIRELDPEGKLGIAITGHSMGGSIASMASLDMKYNGLDGKEKTVSVTTYGAPACFSEDAAARSKDKIDARRIEITGDPISNAYSGMYQHNTSNIVKIPPTKWSATGLNYHTEYTVYAENITEDLIAQGNRRAEEKKLARDKTKPQQDKTKPYSIKDYIFSISSAASSLFTKKKETTLSIEETLKKHSTQQQTTVSNRTKQRTDSLSIE